jgi:hypothetical protein
MCLMQRVESNTGSTAEICDLLSYYAASSGNFLPRFRDNLWGRQAVPKRRQQINTTNCVTTQKSAVLIYFVAKA